MTYPAEVLTDSPLVYWRLGEPSGTSAADASGNGHTGTYFGSPTLGATGLLTGDADTAVTFTSVTSQRVQSASTVHSAGTLAAFALECLIDIPATGTVPFFTVIGGTGVIEVGYSDGDLFFDFTGTGGLRNTSASAVGAGVHHIVAEFTGTAIRIYIDGDLIADDAVTDAGAVFSAAYSFETGGDSGTPSADATLDEAAFYTHALGPTRVAAHATAAGFTPTPPPSAPTVTDVSPTNVNTSGGDTVTITGTSFTDATDLKVDGSSESFTIIDDNTITFTAPAHAAGGVHITVTNPVGTSSTTSADLLTYGGLDAPPGAPDPVTIRVLDLNGDPHTASGLDDGKLPLARCRQITRTRNQPKEAVISFPKYAYTRNDVHVFANDSGVGALHLIEVVRNGIVRFRGFAISAETKSNDGEVTLHCRGIDWVLWTARFLDGKRTNELTNPSFETGDTTGYTDFGALTSTVTTADAIRGTHSLRLQSLTPLGDIYEEQTVAITGTGVGTFITVVYYFKIETIGGHALDRRGLYVEASESGVFKANNYYAIDEATPAGQWIRAKTTIAVPPNTTWDIQVRLYSPPGSILWDDGQMVAMQSVSTASITGNTYEPVDVSEIVGLILAHVQDPTVGKSDLNLGLDNPTVGVTQVKHIQWADHIAWGDQMSEWLDRDDCFDYSVHNDIDGTNELRLHVPQGGTDRRATVTLSYPGNVASFDYNEDGGGTITDDTELDAGDGPDREEGHYADASLIGDLVLQAVNAAPTKSEPSSLDPLAREKVNKARRPAQLVTLTLLGAQLHSGTPYDELLGIGDIPTLELDNGWVQVDGHGRISQIVEYPLDRRLEVTIPVATP